MEKGAATLAAPFYQIVFEVSQAMRIVLWFSVGFAIACAAGSYLYAAELLLALAVVSVLATALVLIIRLKCAKYVATVLAGIGLGALWLLGYHSVYLKDVVALDGQTVSASVEISDFSYETDYGIAADGKIQLHGKAYAVRAYFDKMEMLSPGDTATGQFRLRLTTYGAQEGSTYHQGNGIFLLAYAKDEITVQRTDQIPAKYLPAQLCAEIKNALDRVFPEDTEAFARALLLGDSTKLTYEEDTAFKVSGIRHVIAVSGLHVSILFSLIYILCGKQRWLTALFGIPLLILFAAVAGFTPSIVRACIMQLLMILAMLLKREYDPPTSLAFAVLTMLVINPMVITSVSFQLSVGCMIGIFLFSKRISGRLTAWFGNPKGNTLRGKLTNWFCGSISVSLSAMALTTPLCAAYFGMVSIVGVITNLLTLWIVSLVFYGIMLACILAMIWPVAGILVAEVISWPIRYVQWIADSLASFPWAAVYTCSIYILMWLVLAYILLGLFLVSKKKHPVALAVCVSVSLLLSLAASYIEPRLDSFRMTAIDVGQGQSILFQTADGNYLVDCGGSDNEIAADTVAGMLLSQGIFRLDGFILTHYDDDHAGGVPLLLSRVDVKKLYLPDTSDDGDAKAVLSDHYEDKIQWVRKTTFLGENCKFSLFPGDAADSDNESGLCILFQQENCDILITGDRSSASENKLIESVKLPKLELLVAGHHGSKHATGFGLLSATTPQNVVISVGADNSYGHPAEEMLERLEKFACRVWRTDLDGTIIFRR